ncbi:MAG: D-tyrosyl-tRNA(Tyr) deacylase [Desulfonatronovibrio sp. MSAO_Bac4]|nr:MAG: D-tyrosyl-tRNA(Tyr) deacylase [Desulfonatronovibrio sp. MSAO_Bac4]
MKLVLQRVKWARVKVDQEIRGEIGHGLMILVGFGHGDEDLEHGHLWHLMLDKTLGLRIFPDDNGKLNLGLKDIQGEVLLVPQFTLYADCRKGRRPGFSESAPYEKALKLFESFVSDFKKKCPKVQTGVFGAEMEVELNNLGPITIILDSKDF